MPSVDEEDVETPVFEKSLLVGTFAKFSDEEDVETASFVMSLPVTTLVELGCRNR